MQVAMNEVDASGQVACDNITAATTAIKALLTLRDSANMRCSIRRLCIQVAEQVEIAMNEANGKAGEWGPRTSTNGNVPKDRALLQPLAGRLSVSDRALTIGSNNGHDFVFDKPRDFASFAATYAKRLAALLGVLQGYDGESSYSDETLELAADMAWELEQATELLHANEPKTE